LATAPEDNEQWHGADTGADEDFRVLVSEGELIMKWISIEDMQKIVDVNEKLVKELKDVD
jgi:hypothetical protein